MSEQGIIARHAGTVLIGQLAVMAFGVADTVIAGRYSPQALAVLSLASSIYISIYVALNGLLQIVSRNFRKLSVFCFSFFSLQNRIPRCILPFP
jgi:hypothetical protein